MIMRPRVLILAALLTAILAGAGATLKDTHAATWKALWAKITQGGDSPQAIGQFQVSLLDYANYARLSTGCEPLKLDNELKTWLENEIDAGLPLHDLQEVASRIQQAWPRYLKINVTTATAPSLDMVRDNFHDYLQSTEKEMTHLTTVLRSTTAGMAHQALIVSGQRLLDFSPELLHETTHNAFFNTCPHCKKSHISRAQRHQESSTLECPHCDRAYAVIASDLQARYRYANEFLTGYQPPAVYPEGQTRVEQLFAIWSAVHKSCVYTRDPAHEKQRTDRWQTALETQTLGQGDCEDSSILLADWLIARGFEARVALGKYGDIGGHAWCVVRLDGMEYLLESTVEGNPDFNSPPLVSRIGSRYVPEVLFDRWHIYTRNSNRQTWNGDYWSDSLWLKIDPRGSRQRSDGQDRRPATAHLTPPALQRDFADRSRVAFIKSVAPQASPFLQIDAEQPSPSFWKREVRLQKEGEYPPPLELSPSRAR